MTGDSIEKRLRAALGRSRLLRADIARRTGISEATLSLFLHGKRRLGLAVAAELADALGYRLTLTRKGPRKQDGKG